MFKCCRKFKGCDFFEWVDTEIFHPNCGAGCCIHGSLSGQALMSGCCSWQPQRSPSCNYGDRHGGCSSTIFRSPCSSHHKDDSFGDENESTSVIKEKKSNCVLWFFGVLIVIFIFKMLF
ncbi:hypothetical protein F8388_016292 [Cannabis sativa]|uniref:Uncharacterized protein n=1 Tax=Cannabis sativa TaxID=3483 RepID=A0A7J6E2F7_CANSA|nr:hypothetical protein F8388_016292 [Cannabis sativa]